MQTAAISAKEARKRFAEIVNRVVYGKEQIVITRYDRPEAVLIPFEIHQKETIQKTNQETENRRKILKKFIKLGAGFGKWKAAETIIKERDRERLKWQKLS